MKNKKLFLIIVNLVSLLYLTSCGNNDDNFSESPIFSGRSGIRFEVNLSSQLKVSTDSGYESHFESGDMIGFFAVKSGYSLSNNSTENYINNRKLVYNGSQWILYGTPITYPIDSSLDFYAYYPYKDDAQPDSIIFDVDINQASSYNYDNSHFLSSLALNQKDTVVNLAFKHELALIEVTISKEDIVPAFDKNFSVKLKNIYTKINYGFNKGTNTIGDKKDISMHQIETDGDSFSSRTYRALVPAQLIENDQFILFEQSTQGRKIKFTYNPLNIELASGKVKKIKVNLEYGLNPNHLYKVGDVYPYKGIPIGVVFWIKETNGQGKHGKIVSLDEAQSLSWYYYYYGEGANPPQISQSSSIDGAKNLQLIANYIKNKNALWKHFPFAQWVFEKNGNKNDGIWYIPSKEELKALVLGSIGGHYEYESGSWGEYAGVDNYESSTVRGAQARFNNILENAEGERLKCNFEDTFFYWTSTEYNAENSYMTNLYIPGHTQWASKHIPARIRAIANF